MSIGQLIESLCVANIKLFNICNIKTQIAANPSAFSKKQMADNARADVNLCKTRAQLKNAIDKAISKAILNTEESSVIDEVKSYG